MSITAEDVAQPLKKAQKQNDGSYIACCPAHDDKTPSLSITDSENGEILIKCFAGCTFQEIVERLPVWKNTTHKTYEPEIAFKKDYFNPRRYIYKDENNLPVYMVERSCNGTGKTFKQYTIKNENLTPGIKGVPRLPYRLPEIINHDVIYICEGEQAADAMAQYGYAATCNSGGANNWDDNLNAYFTDKNVIILPDNDSPGHKHALCVAGKLHTFAKSIKIAPVCKDLKEKDDIVDWFCANPKKIYKLHEIIEPFSFWEKGDDIEDIEENPITWILPQKMSYILDANWIVRDLIPASGFGAAYGKPGSGKTFWALDLAMSIASGKGYANKLTKHGPAAYVALESGRRFQNRVIKWAEENKKDIKDIPFIITPDQINLLDPEKDAERIVKSLKKQEKVFKEKFKIVVIDTLSRAMSGGNENSPEDMTAFVASCDKIWKQLNCFILIIHHVGKDVARGLRGHSSLLGAVDTEIEVTSVGLEEDGYKKFKTLKQRDGEDNLEFGFKLNPHLIGNDSDGEALYTCVVEHLNASELPTTKRKHQGPTGANQKTVLKAIQRALDECGQDRTPGAGYPVLKTITENQAKNAAENLLSGDARHKASRFNEALNGLIGNEFVMKNGEFIWLL